MNNWKKYKLAELGKIITGGTPPSKFPLHFGDYMPFITPSDFGNYLKTAHTAKRYISEEGFRANRNKILPPNSVLVTCIGSDMGKVIVNKKACLTNQQINSIIPNTEIIDYNFLYYSTIDQYDLLRSMASDGTTMPIINKTDFENIEIYAPENIEEQQRIASILSSLDDKIDLNRRMNQTLEQIAATLFKKYFVDDIDPDNLPEGWGSGKVEDMFLLQRGFDLPNAERIDGKFPVFAASGFNGFHNKAMVKAPGITTGRSGVIGNVFYILEDFWPLNTSLYVKEYKIATPLYAYYALKSIDLSGMNGGSAVPTLNRNHVHGLGVIIPPKILINQFDEIARPLFELVNKNDKQNKTLSQIRDTLLPKLMSGEIDLSIINQNEELHAEVLS